MGLDKFGRTLKLQASHTPQPPLRLPFSYTPEGNIQFESVQLSNVQAPSKPNDVANKKYVDDKIVTIDGKIKNINTRKRISFNEHDNIDCKHKGIVNLQDPHDGNDAVNLKYMQRTTVGFTYFGNIDCKKKQIVNLADPTVATDAVNRKYLETALNKKVDIITKQVSSRIDPVSKTMISLKLGLQQMNSTTDQLQSKLADLEKQQVKHKEMIRDVIETIKDIQSHQSTNN